MTARIGYLSALTGSDGRLAGGDGSLTSGDEYATLRPPRRVFGLAGFSDAEPGFLDAPGFTDVPGFSPARAPDDHAPPDLPGRPARGPVLRSGRQRRSGPVSGDTSAAARGCLAIDSGEEAAARSAADAGARASRAEADGAWPVPSGTPHGDGRVSAAIGQPLIPEPAGTGIGSADRGTAPRGAVPRAPGEPWRMPRRARPQQVRHGTGAPSAPPHVAAPVTGTESSAARPGAVPPGRATGLRPGGNAAGRSGDQLPSAPPGDARVAAQPQVPGSRQPNAAAKLSPLTAGAPHPGAPLASTSDSGSPLADALVPGAFTDAGAEISALSAAPSAAPLPVAPLAVAPLADSAESSLRHPAANRAQARPTPAVSLARRPPGSRAEASTRPSAPTLSIGTIEVTLLPPPPAPPPARSAQHEPPRRLGRGLGRRFGQGQA
jgi:hypothetical protein